MGVGVGGKSRGVGEWGRLYRETGDGYVCGCVWVCVCVVGYY